MKRPVSMALIAVASLLSVSVAQASAPPREDGDGVVNYSAEDTTMNRAIAEARASLPQYLDRLDTGRLTPGDTLKVGFPASDGGQEHIWVGSVRRVDGGFTGVLANEPFMMPGRHEGDTVEFTQEMISDWSYESNGRMWGAFTLRVMLDDIDPRQAAALRAYLSPTPIEP